MPDPTPVTSSAAQGTLAALLRTCRVPAGHYDELHEPSGELRPHWAAFVERAGHVTSAVLAAAERRIARQLLDNGVTYNVHASGGPPRAWSLDVLPHIVPSDEWQVLERGLRQRARLLEAMARDIYGSQHLLREGIVPPAAIAGHRGFLRPCHGVAPPSGRFLHLVAFDVARTTDGSWRVIETRTQAPSGAGYALENRLSLSSLFPDAFREQHVRRHAPFFRAFRESLVEAAPRDQDAPHVVLLTPGPFSETYFEHAYLARYLGFTLAEGADLTAREGRIFLKTVHGLRPVHGMMRRLDDDFCDPLELRTDSTLGIAGLLQAWREGHVLMANAPGMGVLESPLLPACLDAAARRLLDESLELMSPRAWWCGDPQAAATIARLDQCVVKPLAPGALARTVLGPALDARQCDEWRARIADAPERYVLQEYVPLSHAPVWHEGRIDTRAVLMRVYLRPDGAGDFVALPGGLSRIAGVDRRLVSGQGGGGSKDTWVLSDRPVERVSLLPGRLTVDDIARSERMVSSRAAEHLFWMGRYAERSENGARLMRAVLSRLQEDDSLVTAAHSPVVEVIRGQGLLEPVPEAAADARWTSRALARALTQGLTDARSLQSVAFNVEQTVRVASAVRDRLSGDNWRVLIQLREMLRHDLPRSHGLSDAQDRLDEVILSLVAVGGLEMAHMTRDDGWRFMSMGRHLERLLYVTTTVAGVARSGLTDNPSLLEWLLDVSDSIITYRARYMGRAEWLPVVDLLLFDPRNPRSAVFQLAKLSKHVPLLPAAASLGALVPALERLARTRTTESSDGELFPREDALADFLVQAEEAALQLSDALTLRYFSHVYEPAHATSV
jgi:uncharacterized circularly permuted ATP-grasp superfamily protein/uncharacterized alpha-E superfamily protein